MRLATILALLLILAGAILAVANRTTAEPATARFTVFDSMLYQGKPDLAQYGIKPFRLVYESNFQWTDTSDSAMPLEASVKAVAQDVARTETMVGIDIERWKLDDANRATSIQNYLTVLRWFREAAPNLKIGYYGVVPIRDYWNAIQGESDPRYITWARSNDDLKPVADAVDFLLPSIYTFYDDQGGWVKYAIANIKEARRIGSGKPVYPFIWMEYHPSNKTLGGQLIPGDYWTRQLQTARANADGVVIWGGHRKPWDNNAAWWKATLAFMQATSPDGGPTGNERVWLPLVQRSEPGAPTPSPIATSTAPPAPTAAATPGATPTSGIYSSLQAAASAAWPGNVICIRAGTYKEYVTFAASGSATQPIIFMAWPGEKVVFDGSDRAPNPGSPNDAPDLFTVTGDYLVFRGLELTRAARSGLLNYEGDHNRYEQMIFSNNYANGINIYGSDNVVSDSVAHQNNGTGGFNSDGFKVFQGERNAFRHDTAYANSDDSFDTWTGRDSLLEFNLSYDNGYGRDPNSSTDDGDGVGFKLGGLIDQRRGGLNTARFNVAFRNRGVGFDMNAGEQNRIYNNTACNNALDFNSFGPGGNEFKNNISCANSANLLANDAGAANSWDLRISGLQFVNNTDPTAAGFLRLPPNSPAIDVGVDVGQAFVGKAPDLGAFEVGLPWPR